MSVRHLLSSVLVIGLFLGESQIVVSKSLELKNSKPTNPPKFIVLPRSLHVDEETQIGSDVFQVKAIDGDDDFNWEINYEIEDSFNLFTIDRIDGTIRVGNRIDAENAELIFAGLVDKVTIIATEVYDPEEYPELTPEQTQTKAQIEINIGDLNDHRPILCSYDEYVACKDQENYSFTISSNGRIELDKPLLAKDLDATVNHCQFRAAFAADTPLNITSMFSLTPSHGIRQQEFFLNLKTKQTSGLADWNKSVMRFTIEVTAKDYPAIKAIAVMTGSSKDELR